MTSGNPLSGLELTPSGLDLRGFNLVRGLVIYLPGSVDGQYVILAAQQDSDTETNVTQLRGVFTGTVDWHEFPFHERVRVTGVSVNPEDPDDTNFGVD